MAGPPAKRQPGEVVNGRFLIERELGSGAMGEVFLAHDGILDRDVAMKYLKWIPDRPALIDHFKSEFATLTHLHHPHITKVFDFAQDEGTKQYFFTSEFIGGTDFYTFSVACAPKGIEGLFVQALRALEYLHGNNIFHFDIKPQNVLVTGAMDPNGAAGTARVQVIDFGLAGVGFQGNLIGTPSYMAPEIILRESPTGQADLYSLGVLIYFALTRWNPFRGTDRDETFQRHCTFVPPPPSTLNAKVPTYLDDLLLRLLAKRPADRYATAAQVIQDLNLRCGHRYPVETPETVLAYVPWEGQFIGRTALLEEVAVVLAACRAGRPDRPPVLWIRGHRGAGKSRLLREIKFTAQLAGHATHILDRADVTARMAWLAAIDATLEEPSRPTVFVLDDVQTVVTEGQATELVEGVRTVIGQCRAHLQLGTGPQANRVLVVVSSPNDPAVTQAIATVLRCPSTSVRVLPVGNFTRAELTQYLTTLTGLATPPPALIDKLYAHTEGNPLFVTEVIKQLIAQRIVVDAQGRWKATTFEDLGCEFQQVHVPPTVEAIVAHEYARLPPPQQALMAALAVWGQPATVEVLADLLQRPSPRAGAGQGEGGTPLRATLQALVQHGLLSYDPGTRTYTVRNATKQRGIYQQLGAKERQRLHARAAAWCRDDPECALETRYAHEAQAGGGAPAEHALWELARHHLEVHRPRDAIEALQQLLHLQSGAVRGRCPPEQGPPIGAPLKGTVPGGTVAVRTCLAHAYQAAREYAKARELYLQLRAEVLGCHPSLRSGSSAPLPATTALRCAALEEALGHVAMKTHAYPEAEQWFMQAMSHYPPDDLVHRLRCDNAIGQSQLYRGALTEAIARFINTAEAAKDLPPAERRRITNNDLGYAYYENGQYAEAIAQLEADIAAAELAQQWQVALRAHYHVAGAHLKLAPRDFARAQAHYQQTLTFAKQLNNMEYLVNAYAGLANVANDQQRYTEAIPAYERALDLSARMGEDERTVGITVNLALAQAKQGNFIAAQTHFLSVLSFMTATTMERTLTIRYRCMAHLNLGELYRLQQHRLLAHHHLDAARVLAETTPACHDFLPKILVTMAQLSLGENDRANAESLCTTLHTMPLDDETRHELEETEKSLVE